jgi:hypothetical protein
MKFDPLILRMSRNDVTILIDDALNDHLHCECVDRSDKDIWARHLVEEVANMLAASPDPDGSYAKYAEEICPEVVP